MSNPYPICDECIFAAETLDKDPCQECIKAFLTQRIKLNFVSKRTPKTNADRIRAMTDNELAEFLRKIRGGCRGLTTESYVCDFYKEDFTEDCNSCWLDWLKQVE